MEINFIDFIKVFIEMLLKNFRMQLICISMDGNVPYLDKVPAGKFEKKRKEF